MRSRSEMDVPSEMFFLGFDMIRNAYFGMILQKKIGLDRNDDAYFISVGLRI